MHKLWSVFGHKNKVQIDCELQREGIQPNALVNLPQEQQTQPRLNTLKQIN